MLSKGKKNLLVGAKNSMKLSCIFQIVSVVKKVLHILYKHVVLWRFQFVWINNYMWIWQFLLAIFPSNINLPDRSELKAGSNFCNIVCADTKYFKDYDHMWIWLNNMNNIA